MMDDWRPQVPGPPLRGTPTQLNISFSRAYGRDVKPRIMNPGVPTATRPLPFHLDAPVNSSVWCLFIVRSPGLQRSGELRACGENAVREK